MPDVYGPFTTATWGQAPWFRDRGPVEPSGVVGLPAAAPTAGDLSLATNGLTLSLGLGRAHVRGAGYERTGTAWTYATPANTNATLARIDRVVLRRDLVAQTVVPVVLQGTPAATPAAPALSRAEDGAWDLPLHQVTVPPASGTVLTVVDERPWIDPDSGQAVQPYALIGNDGVAAVAAVTTATATKVTGIAIGEDPFRGWDSVTGRWTCPPGQGGLYEVQGSSAWDASAAGSRRVTAFRRNEVASGMGTGATPPIGANALQTPLAGGVFRLVPGDTLSMWVLHDTGANLGLQRATTWFSLRRIAP